MKLLHAIAPYHPSTNQQRMLDTVFNVPYYTLAEPLPDGSIRYRYGGDPPQIFSAQAIVDEIHYLDENQEQDPDADIECEHENYDADGYCQNCEYYNEEMVAQ